MKTVTVIDRGATLHESADYMLDYHAGRVSLLSDAQILAILVGEKNTPKLMEAFGNLDALGVAPEGELAKHLGKRTARRLYVTLHLPLRQVVPQGSINCPAAAFGAVQNIAMEEQEVFVVVALNTRTRIIGKKELYRGTINAARIRVAEVFRYLVGCNATAFLVAHNHPSGDPTPSPEDVRVTETLKKVGNDMDIELLDHIIVAGLPHHMGREYCSLKERGLGW